MNIAPCLIVAVSYVAPLSALAATPPDPSAIFVEAEAFDDVGGWAIDTATTMTVGSPYLLAHGLGRPVADATTTIAVPAAGEYRVWVRTRDWVASWGAPGAPGRFSVLVDGRPLDATFGVARADWHWQDGGVVSLEAGATSLALRDLTGFDGRCDAILFLPADGPAPPSARALPAARRAWLDVAEAPERHDGYDLVVVGGGYAGMAAAIAAARQSLRVALIQDRFVLGGNGSSEVRVWANGGTMRGALSAPRRDRRGVRRPRARQPGRWRNTSAMQLKEATCAGREPTLEAVPRTLRGRRRAVSPRAAE